MKHYSLPLDIQSMKSMDKEVDRIDMSDLRFKGDLSKQKRSAFLFLRNTNLDATLDFSKCSYEDKVEFLLMFMQGDIEVQCKTLASTWMEILMHECSDDIILSCILEHDEIHRFVESQKDFIKEIMNLVYSLPVYAIYLYWFMTKDKPEAPDSEPFDTRGFPLCDYDGINPGNFCQLTQFDDFMMIISPPEGFVPMYYTKYFNHDNLAMSITIDTLPYINLINIMMGDKEAHTDFANGISEMLTVGGETN